MSERTDGVVSIDSEKGEHWEPGSRIEGRSQERSQREAGACSLSHQLEGVYPRFLKDVSLLGDIIGDASQKADAVKALINDELLMTRECQRRLQESSRKSSALLALFRAVLKKEAGANRATLLERTRDCVSSSDFHGTDFQRTVNGCIEFIVGEIAGFFGRRGASQDSKDALSSIVRLYRTMLDHGTSYEKSLSRYQWILDRVLISYTLANDVSKWNSHDNDRVNLSGGGIPVDELLQGEYLRINLEYVQLDLERIRLNLERRLKASRGEKTKAIISELELLEESLQRLDDQRNNHDSENNEAEAGRTLIHEDLYYQVGYILPLQDKVDHFLANPDSLPEMVSLMPELAKHYNIFIAGSTIEPEDVCVMKAYLEMKKSYKGPPTLLIIAPDFATKYTAQAERTAEEMGISTARWTTITGMKHSSSKVDSDPTISHADSIAALREDNVEVLFVDFMGALLYLFKWATGAFIGGGLLYRECHNYWEPLAFGLRTWAGPYQLDVPLLKETLKGNDPEILHYVSEDGVNGMFQEWFSRNTEGVMTADERRARVRTLLNDARERCRDALKDEDRWVQDYLMKLRSDLKDEPFEEGLSPDQLASILKSGFLRKKNFDSINWQGSGVGESESDESGPQEEYYVAHFLPWMVGEKPREWK